VELRVKRRSVDWYLPSYPLQPIDLSRRIKSSIHVRGDGACRVYVEGSGSSEIPIAEAAASKSYEIRVSIAPRASPFSNTSSRPNAANACATELAGRLGTAVAEDCMCWTATETEMGVRTGEREDGSRRIHRRSVCHREFYCGWNQDIHRAGWSRYAAVPGGTWRLARRIGLM
jgi:hypothetical protein